MGKKVEKEKNELVEEFFRRNDPKNIKSMNDMYAAWKDFFAPAFQQLLDAEMEAKLGYAKNERTDNENYRNGYYPERTVSTEMGDIPVKVPRDRKGEIDSDLVPKYSRTVNGFDEKVISMYALGLSDKDIQEQIKDIFGCNLSPDMISDITDKVVPEIQEWQKRKLESVYPIIFIDATHFHVRDNGQIVKKAAYVVLGIDKDGMKKVLTITIGENESAKYWMTVLNERSARYTNIVCRWINWTKRSNISHISPNRISKVYCTSNKKLFKVCSIHRQKRISKRFKNSIQGKYRRNRLYKFIRVRREVEKQISRSNTKLDR